MHFPSRATALGLITCLFFLASPTMAMAAETVSSDTVLIREGVVVSDDLYASGLVVIIDGEVEGDLTAIAGEKIVINGTVDGSVLAFSQEVTINGSVAGSVRSVSGSTVINGTVGRDLVVSGVRGDVSADGEVAGDLLLWTWNGSILGFIGGDLRGVQRNLDLAGTVSGNVDTTVRRLKIMASLEVGGDMTYRSNREAEGVDLVEAGGVIVRETPLPSNIRVRALGLFGKILTILFLAGIAMLIAMSWPDPVVRAGDAIRSNPIKSYLLGLAALTAPVALFGIGLVVMNLAPASASLPLLAVIVPLALGLLVLAGFVAVMSVTPAVQVLGALAWRGADLYKAVALGSGLVAVIWLLPWVSWLVPLLFMPTGVGAWILAIRQYGKAPSAEPAR